MSDLALYRRLLRQARPYWLHLALLFCIGVLASPIALLNPVPLKIVVDSVIGTRPLPPAVRALLPETIAGSPGALLAPGGRRRHRHIKKLESSALAVVQETLGALRVVKAFGGEQQETDRFAQRSREGVAARIRMALTEGRYGLLVGLTTALGTGAVLFIGVRHVQANLLTLGQLLMAVTY